MFEKKYYIYIMASVTGTLYIGVTNSLLRRVAEHKSGQGSAFTAKYQCHKLVYYEVFGTSFDAIRREKELKGWNRLKKQNLIKTINTHWKDLSDEFC